MIFVDTNIPMYLVGEQHPNRTRIAGLLARLLLSGEQLVTDAEVYQEVLHRYAALGRLEAATFAFEYLDRLVSQVFSFGRDEVLQAKLVLDSAPRLSARDALHLAVMQRAGVNRILSFDRGFDAFPEVERLS